MVIKRVKKLAKKAVTPRKKIDPRGTGQGALSKQDWEGVKQRMRDLETEFKNKKKRKTK